MGSRAKTSLQTYSRKQIGRTLAVLMLSTQVNRARMARLSLLFFCYYYFGIVLYAHQIRWCETLLKSRRAVLLAPRGHGKTEVAGKLLMLWIIVRDRNIRILLVAKKKDGAQKSVTLVRDILELNKKLRRDFGAFYSLKFSTQWRQDRFTVIRSADHKDPTMEAVGLFGAITGGRFDLVVFDDLIDVESSRTDTVRANVEEEVVRTYQPLLTPEGKLWAVGTRKHFADIYSKLLKRQGWRKIVDQAIIREPASWEIQQLDRPIIKANGEEVWEMVVIHGTDRGECLCEEIWSMERLLWERYDMGTFGFNMEYMNTVVDDETSMFPLAHLRQCLDEDMSYHLGEIPPSTRDRYVSIFGGVDPALVTREQDVERRRNSWFVQVAIGVTARREYHLLALDRFQGLSPHKKEKRIRNFCERTDPLRLAIEDNAFGVIYRENIIEETDLPIVPHHTGSNKSDPYEGMPVVSGLFENRKFRLPYRTDIDRQITDQVIEDFHHFGYEESPDIPMAVWICVSLIRRWLTAEARRRQIDQAMSKGARR